MISYLPCTLLAAEIRYPELKIQGQYAKACMSSVTGRLGQEESRVVWVMHATAFFSERRDLAGGRSWTTTRKG